MAWTNKAANELQVFRGSKPKADVFLKDAILGAGCCPSGLTVDYDKLARRVRFDNGLSHLNPLGGNEKFHVPEGDGFSSSRSEIVAHINEFGVGARIAVIAIPTFAFLTGVGIHIEAEEPGLTFNLVTRNGLALPNDSVIQVVSSGDACAPTRVQTVGSLAGFGDLPANALSVDIFAREAVGMFALESDELVLEVAAMPAEPVTGAFSIRVSASYQLIDRAEQ